ncbi:MAG TPA: hypothetical protein VMM36_03850 [Opitutaceae bacterium]|nr:hypothetical protein [Opitutaceae bacterium]
MARLTEAERAQLKRSTSVREQPPKPRLLTPAEYVAFATLASKVARVAKRPPFTGGEHWKL